MTNQEALSFLTITSENLGAQINKMQQEKDAIDTALSIIQLGYQTDQQTITDGVSAVLGEKVKEVTDPLNAQIADLQAQVVALTPPPAP